MAGGIATLAVAALLVVAWLWPPAAIAIVWPALFLVPGLGIVAWARPTVGVTGRLGLAIVLSAAVSAHAVYWLSLALGYGRGTTFVVAALLWLPLPIVLWLRGAPALRDAARGSRRALRRSWPPLALAALTTLVVGGVLQAGLWHATDTGVAAGGSNWSDLGVHLAIAQSLNAGNFPPQVPYFAGQPLIYHWFADFHAAIAAQSAGIFAVPAFVVSAALLAGALALVVHGLARALLRGPRARRAAFLAAVLVVFAGGLGWTRFIGDVFTGVDAPLTLLTENSYDNSWYDAAGNPGPMWPYFRIPSVMGTGLLVHRATTYGLPILVGAVLLLVVGLPARRRLAAGWRDRPRVIGLAGLLGALLAPFHFFFFPAFLLLGLLYAAAAGRLLDRDAPRNAALVLGPMLVAVPFAVAAVANARGSGALRPVAGWESAPWADGIGAVVFFYATNLGVPLLLALAALLAPRTPSRGFIGAWLVALFVLPNVVQVSHVAFDMNKYFQAMWVAVALLAAWLIRRWRWPAVALVLLVSIPSPLLVAAYTALNREQVLSHPEVRAADWIAANTPERSVFATDGWLNAPTDPAGRLRLLTFTPYVANLGFDPNERERLLYLVYCGEGPRQSIAILRQLGATHLLDHRRPGGCLTPVDFTRVPGLELLYDRDGIRIWRVSETDVASGRR